MNANLRLMGGVLRYLKHMNNEEKLREEWELRMKTGILNRILDTGVRYQGMAWRNAIEFTRMMRAQEEKELRLRKKVCSMLKDTTFALQVACFNGLKACRNLALLDDDKEKMLGEMRNGLLDGMCKNKERFNRQMTKLAFDKLVKANEKITRMTKSIVLFINKNGERQLLAGLTKLIDNKRERDAYFNEYRPRMTKTLMKFMRDSATFMLSVGLQAMRDNKANYDALNAKRHRLVKMLEHVIMKNDEIAKRFHMDKLVAYRLKMIKGEKVMKLVNSCATGKVFRAWDLMLRNCDLVRKLMKMNGEQKKRLVEKLTASLESTAVGLWAKGFKALTDHYKLEMIKERVIKNLFTKILCKSDIYLQVGMKKLVSNNNIKKTFKKCRSLFNACRIADSKWQQTLAYNYKLIKSFRRMNPWYRKMVDRLTKNVRVDQQISFWRMKDYRKSNLSLPANKIVKMKKMFAILKKYYELSLARSFWRIERYMDPETTFNLSTVFQNDPNKSIGSIGGYPLMSEVDPREHQEVKERGCEITADILGDYAGRLKSSAFRMLALKSGLSKKVIGERLNEVLMDEEIVSMAKENALSTLASKLEGRLTLIKMKKYLKMLSLRKQAILQSLSEKEDPNDQVGVLTKEVDDYKNELALMRNHFAIVYVNRVAYIFNKYIQIQKLKAFYDIRTFEQSYFQGQTEENMTEGVSYTEGITEQGDDISQTGRSVTGRSQTGRSLRSSPGQRN